MAGVELIISAICNTTFCEPLYDNVDTQLSKKWTDYLNLKNEVNGKHLKIATYNNYPLSYAEEVNGTLEGRGVAFEIIKILQERFNFTYDVILPKKNFEFGGPSPEQSLVGLLNSNEADMAAAFIAKLPRFRGSVMFSTELDEGTWAMMLKRPKASAAGSGLTAPFDGLVWYLTIAAVFCYGPCITLLTRLRSKLLRDEDHLPLSPSFWFVYSAFIKQGTSLAPEANSTRILFATWWMFIILLSAFYTANLTAFLTLSKFTLDIETPEDLYKKNFRWVAIEGGSVQYTVKNVNEELHYLSKMIANGRAEFQPLVTKADFLSVVDNGAVLVQDVVTIDHIMYGDYISKAMEGVIEADRCTYVVAPKPFMRKQRAFAYPLDSPLKALFDTVLIRLIQAGIMEFLKYKNLPRTKICPLDLQSKERQLRNSDLLMTYLIMGFGLCAATAIFLGEVLLRRYVHEPRKPRAKRSKKSKRRDNSRPPPYDSLFGNKYNLDENSKKKMINGREYYEYISSSGDTRLIPVRSPSAFLFR